MQSPSILLQSPFKLLSSESSSDTSILSGSTEPIIKFPSYLDSISFFASATASQISVTIIFLKSSEKTAKAIVKLAQEKKIKIRLEDIFS